MSFDWSFPTENNASSCRYSNDTLIRTCYGRAKCISFGQSGYLCDCPTYYELSSHCEKNVFEIYQGRDLYYPVGGIIFLSILFILFCLEVIADVRTAKRFWKTPMFYAKTGMILFAFLRLLFFSIWLERSLTYVAVHGILMGIALGFGTVLLCAVFPITVLSWIDLLSRAKTLGENRFKVKFIKIVIYCVLAISLPILFVGSVLATVGFDSKTSALILAVVIVIITVICFVVDVYLLVSVFPWIQDQSKLSASGPRTSSTFAIIKRKTNIVVVSLVFLLLCLVSNAIQIAYGISTPLRFLALSSVNRIAEALLAFSLFAFLENHFVKRGFLVGYCKTIVDPEKVGSSTRRSTVPLSGKASARTSTASSKDMKSASQAPAPDSVKSSSASKSSQAHE